MRTFTAPLPCLFGGLPFSVPAPDAAGEAFADVPLGDASLLAAAAWQLPPSPLPGPPPSPSPGARPFSAPSGVT